MSNINIERIAKEDNSKTTIYTPIIEAAVNSIESIKEKGISNGFIDIIFEREKTTETLDSNMAKPSFNKVSIIDNGIGFNNANLTSFDTLRTDYKIKKGGKGYGRIMYKKYFKNISIISVYKNGNSFNEVSFDFGDKEFIDNKKVIEQVDINESKTELIFRVIKKGEFAKELATMSRIILEKLLIYFISYDELPKIRLRQGEEEIILNEIVKNNSEINKIYEDEFILTKGNNRYNFNIYIFKIYSPNNQKSKIILSADSREVISSNLMEYIPEFEGEFKDEDDKNYIIKTYITGKYLNEEVTTERDSFLFEKNGEITSPLSRKDIEKKAVGIVSEQMGDKLNSRKNKKKNKIKNFLNENPHYRDFKDDINLDLIKMNPNDMDIEQAFHKASYEEEIKNKKEINEYIKNYDKNVEIEVEDIVAKINKSKKSELAHYVTLRKVFLKLLKKTLEVDDSKLKYKREDVVHNIIFPIKKDSDNTRFSDHNLWILDERLSFSEYLRSDMNLTKEGDGRPDILNFDERIVYRNGEEASNPVTIFEFKRPGRFDFFSGNGECPRKQILRYVKKIKDKKVVQYSGREIAIGDNTPFYGYIVADFNNKAETWLEEEGFSPLPNGREWVLYNKPLNLQLYFISWDQLLKNAEQRNSTFFHYLGIR